MKSVRLKTLLLFAFNLFYLISVAQIFPNPAALSTGQGAIGTSDPIWQVSPLTANVPPNPTSGSVSFSPAFIDNNCAPGAWVSPASLPAPVNNGNWITSPGFPCATNPLAGYLYFRLTLNLPADCGGNSVTNPGAYELSLTGYVDNTITDVFVNGTSTGISGGSFSAGTQLNFTLTGPWQAGTNYVDILVYNAIGGNPNPYGLLLVANTANGFVADSDNDGINDINDACICNLGNMPDGCVQPPHPNNCDVVAIRTAVAATCPSCIELSDFANPGCSMYFYNPNSLSGSQAQIFAEQYGGNLVSIQDATENQTVINALNANGLGGTIWIGFNDELQEGVFVWYDQKPVVYTNWAPSEPNNAGGNEDCTQIYPDGFWNDLDCNTANSASVFEISLCPQSVITNAGTICIGNTSSLIGNTILGSQPYTYTWSVAGSGSGNIITVSPVISSSYSVTVSDRYSCTASASSTVNVFAPAISAGPDKIYCIGDSAQLNGNSASNRFSWSPFNNLSDTSIVNPIANPTTTTNYIITGFDDIGNSVLNGDFTGGTVGFNSDYTYGSTPDLPAASFWVGNNANTVHSGFAGIPDHTTGSGNYLVVNGAGTPNLNVWCQTINVEANTNYNFSAWVANLVNGSPAILQFSINGNVLATPFNAPIAVGQWEEFFSTWNSGVSTTAQICIVNQNTTLGGNDFAVDDISFSQICRVSDTVTVTVNPLPLANAGNDVAICLGDSTQLQASGGTLYTWQPTSRLSCVACNNPQAFPLISTDYIVRVSDNNLCVNFDTVAVTVNALPVVSFSNLSNQYCLLDASITLLPNPTGGTFSGNGINGNDFSPNLAGIGIHSVTYTYTDANTCENDITLSTTVNAMPIIDFATIDTAYCLDDNAANLTPSPIGGTWSGNGIQGSQFVPQSVSVGSYRVYYNYIDANNCAVTDSLNITVNELPIVSIAITQPTCYEYNGAVAIATATNGLPPYNYNWSVAGSDSFISNLSPNIYTLTVTDANGCTVSNNGEVFQPTQLTVDIFPPIDSITLGDTVNYSLTSNADTIVSFIWTPNTWLSCADCERPIAIPQESITYNVTITDSNTCMASDSARIFIKPKKAWYVPNIFSPNADNINDVLYAYVKGIKKMTFNLFNRWGEKVFSSEDPLLGWDGNYKNNLASEGVYTYDLYIIYWDNEPRKATGSITLVR